jgi:hypothetical protein
MSLFTADQLVAHAVGDYLLQSHWMATEKTKQNFAAAVHAVTYTLPFVLITQSPGALAAICGSHFLIDRYRLARFVVWAKNWPWETRVTIESDDAGSTEWCSRVLKPVTATGYADDVPAWLSVWLLIIADNILHVICNAVAIATLST